MYSIKDLEKLTGIKAHTLRIWEKRYQIVHPVRTATNIRTYNDEDLKKLLNISILNRHGFRISSIANMKTEQIQEEVVALSKKNSDYDIQIEQLTMAMLDLNETAFEKTLNTAVIKLGFEKSIDNIVFPFLEKAGTLWQIGTINPAQEHFIANLIRQKLILAIDGQPGQQDPGADLMVLFLHVGELHELGLLYYHYLAKKEGLRTLYLGQSVPAMALEQIEENHRPKYFFTAMLTPLTTSAYKQQLTQWSRRFSEQTILITGLQTHQHELPILPNIQIVQNSTSFRQCLRSIKV